jgi:hypothetical protein
MGSTRLKNLKDPKGLPKMPVQLFQEEGFKKTNLRQLLFSKTLMKKKFEVMSAIADKGEEAGLQNGMKLIKYWLILGWNNLED